MQRATFWFVFQKRGLETHKLLNQEGHGKFRQKQPEPTQGSDWLRLRHAEKGKRAMIRGSENIHRDGGAHGDAVHGGLNHEDGRSWCERLEKAVRSNRARSADLGPDKGWLLGHRIMELIQGVGHELHESSALDR